MRDVHIVKATSSVDVHLSAAPSARKASTLLVALLILSVMVVWFGFLGWGVVVLLSWITDWAMAGFSI